MRNAGLDELHVGIKTGGRNNNLRYADDTTLITSTTLAAKEEEEELKNLLIRVKEESERAGLRLNIKKKTKIMASGPNTSWQIDGEAMEIVTDFILGALKSLQMVTVAMKPERRKAGDCSRVTAGPIDLI